MSASQADDATALVARFDIRTTVIDIQGEPFRMQHPRDAMALIDEAAFNRDERLPYWADIWPSAIALARAVRAVDGRGRTFLELGCGVGLVSAAALRAGFDVTASDYYEDALAFARLNGAANASRAPHTMLLDWRDVPAGIPSFDVVAAADVLYESPYGRIVAAAIAATLAENGVAWVADPGRVGTPAFFEVLAEFGLRHVGATVVKVAHADREQPITVHELSR